MSADDVGAAKPRAADERRECTTCRAPIGAAQRYCLTCGARQPGGAVDSDALLGSRTVETAPVLPPAVLSQPAAPSPAAGRRATLGFASVVLLALLVGVLGGRLIGDGDDPPGTSTQVVRVEGLPAAGVASAAAPATAETADAATSKSAARKARAAARKKQAEAKRKAAEVAPKKVTRKKVQETFDDASGNENLAPEDDDPNGANFDEIK